MLTRLKVSGFKNLVDVDVRFGPFTCIAGPNGIGKSNLFDAIRFLSMLADQPLVDAALAVRDEGRRTGDIQGLFHRSGGVLAEQMSFEVEMIVPPTGVDDLGQPAEASITFLRYALTLAYRKDGLGRSPGALEILKEELGQINLGDAREHLRFTHTPVWRRSAIRGRRTSAFISTEDNGPGRTIKLHQDGSSGRPRQFLAATLPRTTLSAVNATENPTALLARRELQSWHLLQLEPSALRRPDPFTAPTQLGADGSHLAATLYRLAQENNPQLPTPSEQQADSEQVYGQVANRLAELIDDVQRVWIDRDERRELLTLYVAGRDQTAHPALALSDGTLRFLALATLDLDPHFQGVLCLEEPENGIHPSRIPAMLQLLRDIATDPNEPVRADNPLRQVLINTHSPVVVQQSPDDSLLMAESRAMSRNLQGVTFVPLSDTWRHSADPTAVVSRGHLLAYLNPVAPAAEEPVDLATNGAQHKAEKSSHRVIDRPDLQLLFPWADVR